MRSDNCQNATGIITRDRNVRLFTRRHQVVRLLLSPPGDAFTNMALDEALARTSDTSLTFRIYYWESPALSLGYFQKILEVLNTLSLAGADSKSSSTVVRRPTGGTAVFHNSQPSFSLIIETPYNIRQIYHLLGQAVIESLKVLGMDASLWEEAAAPNSLFCTSNFFPYDVILSGQKVAGYSARRFRRNTAGAKEVTLFQGYLHPPEPVEEGLLAEALISGMEKTIKKAVAPPGVKLRLKEDNLTEPEVLLTQELRQKKYLQRDWNYKR